MDLKSIPKKPGIYKLTNAINGKSYVGKSVNLYQRIISHKHLKPRYCIDFAIRKYGFQNFKIEVLHYFDNLPENLELLALETAFIIDSESLCSSGGYNICLVGSENSGLKRSEETRKRLSIAKLGKNNPNFGKVIYKPYSSYLGRNNPNFDHKIYSFRHKKTNEVFVGHRQDFYLKFNLSKPNVNAMVRGKEKSVKGWFLERPS